MSDNPVSDVLKLPDGYFLAIDATCPSCGYPERRARLDFDEHGTLFSCHQCPYISREREA